MNRRSFLNGGIAAGALLATGAKADLVPGGLGRLPASLRAAMLPGFYLNGSANPLFKAAVSAVLAGTRRGRVVIKGDSTEVGQGAGSTADTNGLTGARPNRPSAIMAALLTAGGLPCLDTAVVSDNGMYVASNFGLPTYDPRVNPGSPNWAIGGKSGNFAGSGFLQATSGSNAGRFTLTEVGDTCEIVYYNSVANSLLFTVDGAAPSSGPASATIANTGGFSKAVIKASAVSSHAWGVSPGSSSNSLAMRSMLAYSSTATAFDIINHSALGAKSADQAATDSTNRWFNLEALAFDAPDLTIINLGLNDMNGSVAVATYIANLQAIITTAKQTGDVLLMFPHPAGGAYNSGVASYHSQAKALAAGMGVAFLSLFEYYGGAFTPALQARMFDGIVHPRAAMYAEIGAVMKQALVLMSR